MNTTTKQIAERIFTINEHNDVLFEKLALELFRYHAENNETYRDFIGHLGVKTKGISKLNQIPFLPISMFKRHSIGIFNAPPEAIFLSSGTTGMERSQHHVASLKLYEQSLHQCFHQFFGKEKDYCILALLPSYLERSNSSLVYMTQKLMKKGGHPDNGFYLDRLTTLSKVLKKNSEKGVKTLLIGVTFALLELAEKHPQQLENCTVLETGGMKGRRKEMPREEVHDILKTAFGLKNIASEYGMTELLSQAYSLGKGIFQTPPWMRVYAREATDPLSVSERGKGALNVIDLANIHSCPFIATQDLGHIHQDHSFEVLGRMDDAEVRGCNLMVV
ncbi:MAG TPA: acyl transferase [Flavobacteriales bacterium]|nr:acyl transferase [Flavobacteriales bacterium]